MMEIIKSHLSEVLLALFGVVILLIIPYEIRVVSDTPISPRSFPYLIGVLLVILNVMPILSRLFGNRRSEKTKEDEDFKEKAMPKNNRKTILYIFSCLLLWCVAVPSIGYILPTIGVVGITMIILGNRNYLVLILVPLSFVLLIHFTFVKMLRVDLPSGIFTLF